jgi:hypothetical protein
MRSLSICLVSVLTILLGCKNKPADPVKEVDKTEIEEPLAPLKSLTDIDLVELSPEFEAYLIKEKIDQQSTPDGSIEYGDIKNVDSLHINLHGSNQSLKGLPYFTNLRYLKVKATQAATNDTNRYSYAFVVGMIKEYRAPVDTLDVRYNMNLEFLDVSGNSDGGGYAASIGFLKLGKNEKLKTLISVIGMMSKMDLSELVNLETLNVSETHSLTTVMLCTNTKLKNLVSHQVQKFYVADPDKARADWADRTGGAKFLKCP